MTKAQQIPGGGGMGSHYDLSSRALESLLLSKISDDLPKCRNVRRSVRLASLAHGRETHA